MIDWRSLMDADKKLPDIKIAVPEDDWRKEVAYSLCELYYSQYRSQRSYSANQRTRPQTWIRFSCLYAYSHEAFRAV